MNKRAYGAKSTWKRAEAREERKESREIKRERGSRKKAQGRQSEIRAETDGQIEGERGEGKLPENYKLYVVPNRPSEIIPAHPAAIMNM